jgi:hypothetical protein
MAKKRDWGAVTIGRSELALFLNLTPRRVEQLAREGAIPRDGRGRYLLRASVQAYIGHRRRRGGCDLEGLGEALKAALNGGP